MNFIKKMVRGLRKRIKTNLLNERGSWVNLGVAAIGAGSSMYSANKASKGGGQTGKSGYDIVQMPQYSWTEPNLRMTGDFLADSMQRLGRGEAPAYWDKSVDSMRNSMANPLRENYYGRPGERGGLVQQAQGLGAMTGTGPRGTFAQVNKQMKNYATAEQQIDEFLNKQRVNIMQRESEFLPQMMSQMPKGPDAQLAPYAGYPTQQPQKSGFGDLGEMVGPLMGMFGGGGGGSPTSMFGGGGSSFGGQPMDAGMSMMNMGGNSSFGGQPFNAGMSMMNMGGNSTFGGQPFNTNMGSYGLG